MSFTERCTVSMARDNAMFAADSRDEYDSLEDCWAAYRDNVEDTMREREQRRGRPYLEKTWQKTYEKYDDEFARLTGWHPWREDA